MKKFLLSFLIVASAIGSMSAQQDAMFTKYMFNSLIFNPAYAGYYDHMYIGAIHRTQWVGIDGAPSTQSITAHTPLKKDNVGVGFSLINDDIGPTHTVTADLAYAYKIPLGKGKLSIGLQGGITNWKADWTELIRQEDVDPSWDVSPNLWLPNFGLGLMYYTEKFYAGVSSPHLVEYDLRKIEGQDLPIYAKQYRHYFFTTGAAIPLSGSSLVLKPSFLLKNVGLLSGFRKDEGFQNVGAPTEFDIDLSLLIKQMFQVGLSFRSSIEAASKKSTVDSGDIWMSYKMRNGLRLGAAYDFTLTKLKNVNSGSFEIMLGYEFDYQTKRTVTPRYF